MLNVEEPVAVPELAQLKIRQFHFKIPRRQDRCSEKVNSSVGKCAAVSDVGHCHGIGW
ncbi:hypothetical protein J6590_080373 [Homalodisca vitripennis]|nr:hypothetical protein J6590_080373 [Homalodisca vitripennis]